MSNSITIALGDNSHKATLNCVNPDGSSAEGVTVSFSVDDTSVCTIDASTGAITTVAAGGTLVTGTGVRNGFSHVDRGTVNVVDENAGNFSVSIDLT